MNHSPQYHYKGLDADLDEYLSEYKTQTPLESDHYAGECASIICNFSLNPLTARPVISSWAKRSSQKLIT